MTRTPSQWLAHQLAATDKDRILRPQPHARHAPAWFWPTVCLLLALAVYAR